MKLSENELKEKLDSHLIPENCTEIRVPGLNVEIVEKGNLDRTAGKNDAHLLNVQKLIMIATATLVTASDQLHRVTMMLADQSTCSRQQLYMFTAFPNGLACCPRLFTKLLKPVMAHLHMLGFVSTVFIDDTLLMGDSENECVQNVKSLLALFKSCSPDQVCVDPISQNHLFRV